MPRDGAIPDSLSDLLGRIALGWYPPAPALGQFVRVTVGAVAHDHVGRSELRSDGSLVITLSPPKGSAASQSTFKPPPELEAITQGGWLLRSSATFLDQSIDQLGDGQTVRRFVVPTWAAVKTNTRPAYRVLKTSVPIFSAAPNIEVSVRREGGGSEFTSVRGLVLQGAERKYYLIPQARHAVLVATGRGGPLYDGLLTGPELLPLQYILGVTARFGHQFCLDDELSVVAVASQGPASQVDAWRDLAEWHPRTERATRSPPILGRIEQLASSKPEISQALDLWVDAQSKNAREGTVPAGRAITKVARVAATRILMSGYSLESLVKSEDAWSAWIAEHRDEVAALAMPGFEETLLGQVERARVRHASTFVVSVCQRLGIDVEPETRRALAKVTGGDAGEDGGASSEEPGNGRWSLDLLLRLFDSIVYRLVATSSDEGMAPMRMEHLSVLVRASHLAAGFWPQLDVGRVPRTPLFDRIRTFLGELGGRSHGLLVGWLRPLPRHHLRQSIFDASVSPVHRTDISVSLFSVEVGESGEVAKIILNGEVFNIDDELGLDRVLQNVAQDQETIDRLEGLAIVSARPTDAD